MSELISQAKERLRVLKTRQLLLENNLSKTAKEISELEFWVKLSEKLDDSKSTPASLSNLDDSSKGLHPET